MNLENQFFIRYEIVGLLFNTLTANYEYSPSNKKNLLSPNQIELSEQTKNFTVFFFFAAVAFLESTLN